MDINKIKYEMQYKFKRDDNKWYWKGIKEKKMKELYHVLIRGIYSIS